MVMVTDRQTQIRQLADAGKDLQKCWQGFLDAANELTQVAGQSKVFTPAERRAAIAIELVAKVEGKMSKTMKMEFVRQYKILGAPGDFGYDTLEGRAMQAVYEWWNKLVRIPMKRVTSK